MYSIDSRLIGLEFYIEGKLEKSKSEIEKAIKEMKGTVVHFIGRKTAAVVSSAENVKAMGPYMQNAKEIGIQVVPVDFLDAVKFSDPFSLIKDMNLSPWECIDVSGLLSFFNKKDSYQMQKKSFPFSQVNGSHAMAFQCQNRMTFTLTPNRKLRNGKVS